MCGTSNWPAPTNPQSLVCPAPKSCSSLLSWPWNHFITQYFLLSTLQNSFLLTFLYLVSKSFRIYPLTMHWLVYFIIQYLMRVCILLSSLVLRSHRFSSSIFLPGIFLALKKVCSPFFQIEYFISVSDTSTFHRYLSVIRVSICRYVCSPCIFKIELGPILMKFCTIVQINCRKV